MAKKSLSERDICIKFITPVIFSAGRDLQCQMRKKVGFTKGPIIVRGKLHSRGDARRAISSSGHRSGLEGRGLTIQEY